MPAWTGCSSGWGAGRPWVRRPGTYRRHRRTDGSGAPLGAPAPGALTSLPMHEWQVWFVAALLLCVAEMIAPGFWLLSVAVGSLAAGLVSLVLPGAVAPAPAFAGGPLLSLVGVRPLLLRYLHPAGREIRTNVDALAG